ELPPPLRPHAQRLEEAAWRHLRESTPTPCASVRAAGGESFAIDGPASGKAALPGHRGAPVHAAEPPPTMVDHPASHPSSAAALRHFVGHCSHGPRLVPVRER